MIQIAYLHGEKREAEKRDWRRIHHSPLFWVGVAMFLTAILTYVFSEDLSLRPRLHRPDQGPGASSSAGSVNQ
ncbi:MAG: hypothetical protein WAV18_07100 [Roseiarcus sp.]